MMGDLLSEEEVRNVASQVIYDRKRSEALQQKEMCKNRGS